MTIFLVDFDIQIFRAAAVADKECWGVKRATNLLDDMLDNLVADLSTGVLRLFITDRESFRHNYTPTYKANRPEKPRHLLALRKYAVKKLDAISSPYLEADDLLIIHQQMVGDDAVIVTVDKDLKQVPGRFYNPITFKWDKVDNEAAQLNFYTQVLQGDASDNIIGVKDVGAVKAKAMLEGKSEIQMYNVCRWAYGDDVRLESNFALLYLLRTFGDRWTPPKQEGRFNYGR